MLREGLSRAVQNIPPVEFALSSGQRVSICMTDASVGLPVVAQGNTHANTLKVFPAECRERGSTYRSKVQGTVKCTVDGRSFTMERVLGEVPVMVKSNVCNLAKLKPAELIQHGEEAEEMGGYFVINGNERIIRMLIMPRRNFPTCTIRPSWRTRGKQYTEYGVMMRCVKGDQTATNMVLHYLNNGTANLSFSFKKEQFFIPVVMVLKALVDCTDQHVYRLLIRGKEDDSFYKGCVANMLRQAQDENLSHQVAVLKYVGQQFRIKLQLPDWYSDQQVATFLLDQCICIHLETNTDKFNLLVHMTQKLFALAKGECAAESADNPMNQELLLGGHLYLMVIKEKIEVWLTSLKYYMMKRSQIKGVDYQLDQSALSEACGKGPADITRPMEYLMATGNLVSKTGLGLMQASGLTVVADKLNFMRYLSHFRCVHRGAFFAEMRTTTVRRLLPEAWGFLCPVHTPDGAPCGLLNHLSALCEAVNYESPNTHLPRLLASLGMSPYTVPPPGPVRDCYVVLLDGCLLGYVCDSDARTFVGRLRTMKVRGLERVPPMMEIVFVPHTKYASQYAGIYLFTGLARMMRPVKNLRYNAIEMIGTFEQAYLDICITADEFHEGLTTHQELNEYTMLSAIASLTPYSDCNQSPRNMYQCQMGKQTMGTPLHAFQHRSDNKLYRIQTPQSPIVRPYMHDHYNMDNYPLGTNAVVAVISYTGYDMEDAMILNKGSYERGFAHGSVYKTEFIDLHNISRERSRIALMFGCKAGDKRCEGRLGPDGLPAVGTYLTQGDPYYSYINVQTGEAKVEKYKSQEPAYVDQIKACGNDLGTEELQRICIVLRIQRNPIIGDKFASRHGQKGICSQKWPLENMPFTETGMVPDIIFNPHGFPSRMTIGMMIESMAGKSGAMHGLCHDATPFTFSEDNPAIDYFGRCLTKAGYNYHGTERLYSGINGREFEADIFIGVVHYQRLRHMVSDKFQVRTTGPIDQVTHQPVKGRKRAGGIRFGEMERDGLLAHGTSFLLQDRLLNCTDKSLARVCTKCGSIISTRLEKPASKHAAATFEAGPKWMCSVCKTRNTVETIAVPYVFRYLVAELAAMNIKVTLEVK